MSKLLVSPEAEQDLFDIWLYIAEDSLDNADRYLDRLEQQALKLADFKDIGIKRSDLAPDLKCFPFDRYVVYYLDTSTGIELVRVLHAARDIKLIF